MSVVRKRIESIGTKIRQTAKVGGPELIGLSICAVVLYWLVVYIFAHWFSGSDDATKSVGIAFVFFPAWCLNVIAAIAVLASAVFRSDIPRRSFALVSVLWLVPPALFLWPKIFQVMHFDGVRWLIDKTLYGVIR